MDIDVPPPKNAVIIGASLRTLLSSLQKTKEQSSLLEAESSLSTCRAIKSSVKGIRTTAQSQWNARQKINQLPNEVLHEIFQNALVENKIGYVRRPITYFARQQALRRISSHWNQIITSSPYFWNTLCCIDLPRKRFKMALERSSNVGLHIFCRSSDYCRRFVGRMSDESHRWITLDILYDMYWDKQLPLSTPRLKSLTVNGQEWKLPSFSTERTQGVSVVLRHVTDFRWNSAPVTGLHTLELKGVSPAPYLHQLLGIVEASPYLESLTIDDMNPLPPPPNTLRKVTAPYLRYIGSHSLSASESIIDLITHLIVPPTTSVHIRMYASDVARSIPELINQLFGYVCERVQLLDEALAVGLRTDLGHRRGLVLECPPTNPIIKVRFGWWKYKLNTKDGMRAIADMLEPVFRKRRELHFFPSEPSGVAWSLSDALLVGPWGLGLPCLSSLTIPSVFWALDPLVNVEPGSGWAYPALRHLHLLRGEWQPKLLEVVKNRLDSETVESIKTITLEGFDVDPVNVRALRGLGVEVVVD